ncbi:amidohydrolase family protein [Tardisphaera saccharovorans]
MKSDVRRVDLHSHFFPARTRDLLREGIGRIRLAQPDSVGRVFLYDSESGHALTYFSQGSAHVDLEQRLRAMDAYGIGMQVISVSPPNVDVIPDEESASRLARAINDGLAEAASKYPDKFMALATLPMCSPEAAIDEAKRVSRDLGVKGALISSNANKTFYDQRKGYEDVFRTLQDLGMFVFIHPTEPAAWDRVGEDYNLNLIYAWPFDTTLSAARLAFSGLLQRLPKLRVVLAHGGGMIPFYAGRLSMLGHDMRGGGKERGFAVRDPLGELKRYYYDAAVFSANSVRLLVNFAGADHVIFGTDYPFGPEGGNACYDEELRAIEEAVDLQDRDKVLWRNAAGLLGLRSRRTASF